MGVVLQPAARSNGAPRALTGAAHEAASIHPTSVNQSIILRTMSYQRPNTCISNSLQTSANSSRGFSSTHVRSSSQVLRDCKITHFRENICTFQYNVHGWFTQARSWFVRATFRVSSRAVVGALVRVQKYIPDNCLRNKYQSGDSCDFWRCNYVRSRASWFALLSTRIPEGRVHVLSTFVRFHRTCRILKKQQEAPANSVCACLYCYEMIYAVSRTQTPCALNRQANYANGTQQEEGAAAEKQRTRLMIFKVELRDMNSMN